MCAGRQQPAALLTHCSAHRLGGALPLAAAGGLLALGVGDAGGLPLAILIIVPVLGLGGLCGSSSSSNSSSGRSKIAGQCEQHPQ